MSPLKYICLYSGFKYLIIMVDVADLEAIFQDLEDICSRLERRFHFEYKIEIPAPQGSSVGSGLHIMFSCMDGNYYMTIFERGKAQKTRVVTREQLLNRIEKYTSRSQGNSVIDYFFQSFAGDNG
ncbi:VP6 [Sulfolobus filamentous virus 1]|uniref:VP6 n=1 Tax=Sulfolobus filamentous virus 1 TaxID=2304198 RepID=A0A346LU69_SUFV1|nr:VP6 [Sulfolobus filamentous virus 1]AXQ00112.1 VP6 [Sulfolobus filamentous virus 1]